MSKAAESAALIRVASKGVYAGGGPIAEGDKPCKTSGHGLVMRHFGRGWSRMGSAPCITAAMLKPAKQHA